MTVIPFPKVKAGRPIKTMRGAVRDMTSEAFEHIKNPSGALLILMSEDGKYALRTANLEAKLNDFDLLCRAEAFIQDKKLSNLR